MSRIPILALIGAVAMSIVAVMPDVAAADAHLRSVQVLSVSSGRSLPSADVHGDPSEIPTDNVTVRLSGQPESPYLCSVVLRRLGKIVGRGQDGGLVRRGGIELPVELLLKRSFMGRSSDARMRCS
jgi:hypothetical protein